MADQIKEMPVGDMTMPEEEMAMPGAGEMEVMPEEEMAMPGEKQAIELPGTWKLILSQTSLKRSGCS